MKQKINLNNYHKQILSQQGQDGILEKIFECIGTTNKYFVEFGSSGNDEGQGNTAHLRSFGFDGLLMDATQNPYGFQHVNQKYPVKIHFVTASNINELFKKYNVPSSFDLLSIDIDGQDFYVWKNLDDYYKPRVVIIETNYQISPEIDYVMNYDENHNHTDIMSGASLLAFKNLGQYKNYSLVANSGADAIFIRNDILSNLTFEFENTNDVQVLQNLNPYTAHHAYNQQTFISDGFLKSQSVLLQNSEKLQ